MNRPDFDQIAHDVLSKSLQGRPTWGMRINDVADALRDAYAAGQRAMQERAAEMQDEAAVFARETGWHVRADIFSGIAHKIRALEVEHGA